jgi:hypothetical protein
VVVGGGGIGFELESRGRGEGTPVAGEAGLGNSGRRNRHVL